VFTYSFLSRAIPELLEPYETFGIACRWRAIPDRLLRISIPDADKDHLAAVAEERWLDFQSSLSDSGRRYPIPEFKTFVQAVLNYIAKTEKDPLIHRKVVNVVNGLADSLKATRKQVPGEVLAEADHLECLLFAGDDRYFEGNEPPGL
jgi:hypothetical protein